MFPSSSTTSSMKSKLDGSTAPVPPVKVKVAGAKVIKVKGEGSKVKTKPPPVQRYILLSRILGAWRASLLQNPTAALWFTNNFKSTNLLNSPLASNTAAANVKIISIYQSSSPSSKPKSSQLYISFNQLTAIKSSLIKAGVDRSLIESTFKEEWIQTHGGELGIVGKAIFNSGSEMLEKHEILQLASKVKESTSVTSSRESSPRLPLGKLKISTPLSSLPSSTTSSTSNSGNNTPSTTRVESLPIYQPSSSTSTSSISIPAVKAFAKRSNSLLESRPPLTPSTSHESSPEPTSKKVKIKLDPEELEARDQSQLVGKNKVLQLCRETFDLAIKGEQGAAFLALDIETWERHHGLLLEFGWSFLDCEKKEGEEAVHIRREDQHIIVKENMHRRNGKFSPDARDHFDFGRSLVLPEQGLYTLLHALLETLSSSTPLFLIFHDPRSDLRSLDQLGFDTSTFQSELHKLSSLGGERNNIYIVDTQVLYAAWIGKNRQVRLSTCCEVLECPTKRLHNAGNDARYTLEIFERLMDRNRPVPVDVDAIPQKQ